MSLVQVIGGNFQDPQGTVVANGYLTLELCSDSQSTSPLAQIVGGLVTKIPLDNNGNIAGTAMVFPNDTLNPANSCYLVEVFKQDGTRAWKSPQYQQILSSPNPFDVTVWVPGSDAGCGCGSGQGGGLCPSGILLQTNGINNVDQCQLSLEAGSDITLTDNGNGIVTIASTGGSGGNATFVDAEIPSGTINGINASFTLANPPTPAGSLVLVQDGVVLSPGGVGYTLSGANITCTNAPIVNLIAWYRISSSGINFADSEIPTGTINGVNSSFTLAHSPNPGASLMLIQDGILLSPSGVGFTLAGNHVTTTNPPIANLLAFYRY